MNEVLPGRLRLPRLLEDMAPKAAAAAEPADVIASVAAASGATAKATAMEPLIAALAETPDAVVAEGVQLFQEVASVLAEVAAVPLAELTPELAAAVATCAQLITGGCDAGALAVVLPACAPPLMMIVTPPPSRAVRPSTEPEAAPAAAPASNEVTQPVWREAALTETRVALLTSATASLGALATSAQGRLVLRKGGAMASMLALLAPAVASHVALQAHAALTLSRKSRSPDGDPRPAR
jgi:hypothetical protein